MEKKAPAPILATVFSRKKMRFIYNKARALNLAAFHCIYPNFKQETMVKALLAYFVSDISRELMTIQRRVYGGGLYKFEPRDLENIPVIDVTKLDQSLVTYLANLFDDFVKAEKNSDEERIKKIKKEIDKIIGEIFQKFYNLT
jgi:adenine-specific DNA-methyltransferase